MKNLIILALLILICAAGFFLVPQYSHTQKIFDGETSVRAFAPRIQLENGNEKK